MAGSIPTFDEPRYGCCSDFSANLDVEFSSLYAFIVKHAFVRLDFETRRQKALLYEGDE